MRHATSYGKGFPIVIVPLAVVFRPVEAPPKRYHCLLVVEAAHFARLSRGHSRSSELSLPGKMSFKWLGVGDVRREDVPEGNGVDWMSYSQQK